MMGRIRAITVRVHKNYTQVVERITVINAYNYIERSTDQTHSLEFAVNGANIEEVIDETFRKDVPDKPTGIPNFDWYFEIKIVQQGDGLAYDVESARVIHPSKGGVDVTKFFNGEFKTKLVTAAFTAIADKDGEKLTSLLKNLIAVKS